MVMGAYKVLNSNFLMEDLKQVTDHGIDRGFSSYSEVNKTVVFKAC